MGIAQAALDAAVAYAKERQAFGQPIAEHQGIQFMLADMAGADARRAAAALPRGEMIDEGGTDPTLDPHERRMAKLVCSDTAMEVATDAVQVLGGYGYMSEYPVERIMRDAKITQIYEGTNQIQRIVIARELLQGR